MYPGIPGLDMLLIKVNDHFEFSLKRQDGQTFVNDDIITADIRQINDTQWHIISALKSYNAEIVAFDSVLKIATIKINGNIYILKAKDQLDLMLEKLGLNELSGPVMNEVKAPMPGLVIKLYVAEGTTVKEGDNLFILEAMKMENIIKSPVDGVLEYLSIRQGDKVEKGQVLIKLKQ